MSFNDEFCSLEVTFDLKYVKTHAALCLQQAGVQCCLNILFITTCTILLTLS